jgi:hypothetical protein
VLQQSFRHSSVQVRADLNYSESRQTHDAQAAPTPLRQNPGGCHVAIPGLLRHVEPICYAREHNEPRGQREFAGSILGGRSGPCGLGGIDAMNRNSRRRAKAELKIRRQEGETLVNPKSKRNKPWWGGGSVNGFL